MGCTEIGLIASGKAITSLLILVAVMALVAVDLAADLTPGESG